jgi:WD40 repeat protein
VIPAIAEHEIDEHVSEWRRSIVIPGRVKGDLLTGLAEALAAPEAIPELRSDPNWLKELAFVMGRDPELAVRHVVRPVLAGCRTKGGEVRLILLVDQLEELFTEASVGMEAREQFFHAIESLARSGFTWVLATVRSDFYDHCQSSPALVRMKEGAGQIDVLLPEPDALRRLIVEPTRLAGLRFEEQNNRSLADVLLRDAVAHRELLPLLEYALRELFDERTSEGLLTFAAYAKLSGVEGALARRAEQTFLKLSPEAQGALDSVLSALFSVSGDEKTSFVRRRTPSAELARDPDARAFTHAFVEERLLTTDAAGAGGAATIAVAHEALIRVWPRAQEWAARNVEFLRLRASIDQSQRRWRQSGRDPSLLLQEGLPLEEGRRLLAAGPQRVDTQVSSYIELSIANHSLRRLRTMRRRRYVIASLSILTVAALIGAVYGISQASKARKAAAHAIEQSEKVRQSEQKVRETASNADFMLAGQQDTVSGTLAYLADALRYNSSNRRAIVRTVSLLRRDLLASQSFRLPEGSKVLALSDDASLVAAITKHQVVQIFNVVSDQIIDSKLILSKQYVENLGAGGCFSPDNKRLVIFCGNGHGWDLDFWSAETGKLLAHAENSDYAFRTAKFSYDGNFVVTTSHWSTADVWDAATGKEISKPMDESDVADAQFTPDGKWIITVTALETNPNDEVQVWNWRTGKPVGKSIGGDEAGRIKVVTCSPDGQLLLTAFEDGTVKITKTKTGELKASLTKGDGIISAGAFRHDSQAIALGSTTGAASVWSVESINKLGREPLFMIPKGDPVSSIGFDRDGLRVLIVTNNTARVWDSAKRSATTEPMIVGEPIVAAKFDNTGDSVVTVSQHGLVETWDAHERPAGLVMLPEDVAESDRFDADYALKLQREDTRAGFGLVAKAVKVNDGPMGWQIHFLGTDQKPFGVPIQGYARLLDFQFFQGGKTIVVATGQGGAEPDHPDERETCAVKTWDVETGKLVAEPISVETRQADVSLSPDGGHAVISVSDTDSKSDIHLQIWDVAKGTKVGWPIKAQSCLGFDPLGQRMVVKSNSDDLGDFGQIWDLISARPSGWPMVSEDDISSVTFSADGQFLAMLSRASRSVQIWETQNGLPISGELSVDPSVTAVKFSSDGKWLVGLGDRTYLWDVSLTTATAPAWLADLAEVAGGERLNPAGALEPVDKTLSQLRPLPKQISGNDALSRFARWFVSDPKKRPISPFFKLTAKDVVEQERRLFEKQEAEREAQGDFSQAPGLTLEQQEAAETRWRQKDARESIGGAKPAPQ